MLGLLPESDLFKELIDPILASRILDQTQENKCASDIKTMFISQINGAAKLRLLKEIFKRIKREASMKSIDGRVLFTLSYALGTILASIKYLPE